MSRALAVSGSSVICAVTALLSLVYQSVLLANLGASADLDRFYLCRTLPFYLERLGHSYLHMIMFPMLVLAPRGLGGALRGLFRNRFMLALVGAYALLLLLPAPALQLFRLGSESAAGSAWLMRLVVLGSVLLVLSTFCMFWLYARGAYISGNTGTLINVSVSLTVVLLCWRDLTLTRVALGYVAGAAVQLAWFAAVGRRRRGPVQSVTPPFPRGGAGYAAGMSVVGSVSMIADRVATAPMAAGNVSIMKVGRQLVEAIWTVLFGGLHSSSYTLQCEARRERVDPEALALHDCAIVAVISALLILGLGFLGREALTLVFGHGRFGAAETARLHLCIVAMSVSLAFAPMATLLHYRYFIARQFRVVFLIGIVVMAADIVFKVLLLEYGVVGIGAANAAAHALSAVLLAAWLPRRFAATFFAVLIRFAVLLLGALAAGLAGQRLMAGPDWVRHLGGAAVAGIAWCVLGRLLFAATVRELLASVWKIGTLLRRRLAAAADGA